MEREEIEAMWERIKALEKNSVEVARQAASFEVSSAYHLIAAVFLVLAVSGKPDKVGAYAKYMYPRFESADKAVLGAPNIQEAFKIATDFHNDCFSYLKSQISR